MAKQSFNQLVHEGIKRKDSKAYRAMQALKKPKDVIPYDQLESHIGKLVQLRYPGPGYWRLIAILEDRAIVETPKTRFRKEVDACDVCYDRGH